jgi:hypothetical protein
MQELRSPCGDPRSRLASPAIGPASACHPCHARTLPRTRLLPNLTVIGLRSVDQWKVSGQCAMIRIRRSASCQVSGIDAVVRYRPVSL